MLLIKYKLENQHNNELCLIYIGNKDVRNSVGVGDPIFAILHGTLVEISSCSVNENKDKEAHVEVGKKRAKSTDKTPTEGHHEVPSVVNLSGKSVPSICE